jgi:hypothetical protein
MLEVENDVYEMSTFDFEGLLFMPLLIQRCEGMLTAQAALWSYFQARRQARVPIN